MKIVDLKTINLEMVSTQDLENLYAAIGMELQERDMGKIINIIRALILDENGKEIITEDSMLPTDILIKVVAKVVSILGKSSMGS